MDYYLPRLRQQLSEQAKSIVGSDKVVVEDANDKFDADLAIPVFAFAGGQNKSPQELAKQVAEKLEHEDIAKIETAGGFVNIWLKPQALSSMIEYADENYGNHDSLSGQEIIIEHTDPNPFKELHIGHLYSNTVGESLARLHESAGAKVHRVSYHGDVGLHIAKAIWALGKAMDWNSGNLENTEVLRGGCQGLRSR